MPFLRDGSYLLDDSTLTGNPTPAEKARAEEDLEAERELFEKMAADLEAGRGVYSKKKKRKKK